MSTKNSAIKSAAKENGVCLWEVAEALGLTDANFSRKLRHELSDDERDAVLSIIAALAERR